MEIDYSTGSVFVDGVELMEFYIREPTYVDEGIVFPLEIPEGCVFVMGDNRNRSDDSRNPLLGPVNTGHILGKATLLVLPGVSADTNVRDFSRIGKIAW